MATAKPTAAAPEIAADRYIEIWHLHDDEPTEPAAYARFLARMAQMRGDAIRQWATCVVDSVTSMDILARKWFQYKLNPSKVPLGLHDTRPWRAGSTDTLEENLYIRLGSWPVNVVTVAHINEDKDEVSGAFVRNPSAPGRLSKRLPAGYSELLHMYVTRDENGNRVHAVQTMNDGRMNATNSIGAPDPCWPTYEALWEGWPKATARPPIHAIVYGDSGVGKSTFATTWPCPMLVCMFDSVGKDMPYRRCGELRGEFVDPDGTPVQVIERRTR
jgi:hypothetical protein